ncbi:hypothetical protein FA15DRAFT_652638 [Coprinopsis marcescibilis]|uniref:Uncharacterized protein n=1 Tax=Coprinopsis marcescibilis TaxID=230819 RepID=A0A5C3L9D3_COPMA|nr:hypothetical protein FA15DRAFT_652638 [Coprinopsis marcescibilis]
MSSAIPKFEVPGLPIPPNRPVSPENVQYLHNIIARLMKVAPHLVSEFEIGYGIAPVPAGAGTDDGCSAFNRLQNLVFTIGRALNLSVEDQWSPWTDVSAARLAHRQAVAHFVAVKKLEKVLANTRRSAGVST